MIVSLNIRYEIDIPEEDELYAIPKDEQVDYARNCWDELFDYYRPLEKSGMK